VLDEDEQLIADLAPGSADDRGTRGTAVEGKRFATPTRRAPRFARLKKEATYDLA